MDSPIVLKKINKDRKHRKLLSNPVEWKDWKRKRLRDGGQSYISRRNKSVEERRKPVSEFDCRCNKPGCKMVSIEQKTKLFEQYYKGNYNEQTAILMKCIDIHDVKRRKAGNTDATSRRLCSFTYKVYNITICKKMLIHIFDISARRIQTVQMHIKNGELNYKDQRGKHHNRPHALNYNDREIIVKHFKSFPTMSSHYSRNKSNKNYLSSDLTISKMYRNFIQEHPEVTVSKTMYRTVFHQLKLKIGLPRSDTCKVCDSLFLKLRLAKTEEERSLIQLESERHHLEADSAYKELKNDEDKAKQNHNITVLCVDLQQVLLCPTLTHSSMFYQRQLSSYNFAVNNLGKNNVTFYTWNETIAKRGSAEISSCILNYVTENFMPEQNSDRKLIIWSDRCVGQNNNWKNLTLYRTLVSLGYFQEVHQKFLCSGHTFLPCDRDFALIEKRKRVSKIMVPEEWKYVIASSFTNRSFFIKEMKAPDFKNLQELDNGIQRTKIKITTFVWLKFSTDDINSIYVRNSHSVLQPFKVFRVFSKDPPNTQHLQDFPILYMNSLPISTEKKRDLLDMLQYMDEKYHQYYIEMSSQDT